MRHVAGYTHAARSDWATLARSLEQFDEDKSGSVDLVEFRRGLAHLGFELSDEKFDKLLLRVDRDGDGDINYNEFAARLKGQDQQIGGIGGIGVSDWEVIRACFCFCSVC